MRLSAYLCLTTIANHPQQNGTLGLASKALHAARIMPEQTPASSEAASDDPAQQRSPAKISPSNISQKYSTAPGEFLPSGTLPCALFMALFLEALCLPLPASSPSSPLLGDPSSKS
jgi:hypothetical protein